MSQDSASPASVPHAELIVAVFDTKTMALRTVHELQAAEFDDIWLGVVSGETADGETTVAREGGDESTLWTLLADRGWRPEEAHHFDGILPPGTAVLSLRVLSKADHAVRIIEIAGGHIDL